MEKLEATHYRIREIDGSEYIVTKSEGDALASAKQSNTGIVDIPRIERRVVPSQITSFERTTQAPVEALLLEQGEGGRVTAHKQSIDLDGLIQCSCGRPVMAVLAKRLVSHREYQKFEGAPGYNYLYDSDGMVCVAVTKFVCMIEFLPLEMTECDAGEYAKLRDKVSWLQVPQSA